MLTDAVSIAEEYRADFGGQFKTQSPVTSFRYKLSRSSKQRKTGKKPAPVKVAPPTEKPAAKSDPKNARIQRQLDTVKKKLEDAKASGKLTRPLEDRIYELEDALRLSGQPA